VEYASRRDYKSSLLCGRENRERSATGEGQDVEHLGMKMFLTREGGGFEGCGRTYNKICGENQTRRYFKAPGFEQQPEGVGKKKSGGPMIRKVLKGKFKEPSQWTTGGGEVYIGDRTEH